MASLANNVFWNSVRVGSNLLFPLITFPYTSRVFGPEIKGEFEYVTAVVSYFVLVANLGFPMYGVREVSNNRDSSFDLEKCTNGIFTANVLTASVVTLLFIIFCFTFASSELLYLYLITGTSILLSCIQLDWFFQGVEDYKYITIRSVIIKFLSVIALFIFVRTREDLLLYAILNVIGTLGNNVYNLYRIRYFINMHFVPSEAWIHIKGSLTLFLAAVIVSFYTQINTVMLGVLDTHMSVGLFAAGNKMIHMVLTIITGALAAIIPRITYSVSQRDKAEAERIQHATLNMMLIICLPLCFGTIIMAKEIILIMAGNQFLPAVSLVRLISPLILLITLSNFFGNHVLYAEKKENLGNYCGLIGAFANILLNFVLIQKFSFIGVGIATLVAEFIVTVSAWWFARCYCNLPLRLFFPPKIVISAVIMIVCMLVVRKLSINSFYVSTIAQVLIGIGTYGLCLWLAKEETFMLILNKTCVKYGK